MATQGTSKMIDPFFENVSDKYYHYYCGNSGFFSKLNNSKGSKPPIPGLLGNVRLLVGNLLKVITPQKV